MRVLYWAAAAVVIFTVLSCAVPAVIDPSMNAAEAGDATAIVQGCGSQPIVGYAYCRKNAGDITSIDKLTFFGPEGSCDRDDACTFILIFFPDGTPTLGLSIPKDENSVSVNWSDLTKKQKFDENDRGFWPFVIRTLWKTENDVERETIQEGEIRLRVLNTGYTPLHETAESPHWGWAWKAGDRVFKMTTAGRAHVGNH